MLAEVGEKQLEELFSVMLFTSDFLFIGCLQGEGCVGDDVFDTCASAAELMEDRASLMS